MRSKRLYFEKIILNETTFEENYWNSIYSLKVIKYFELS